MKQSRPVDRPPVPWFGEDKLKHFFTSFVVGSLSASGARVAGLDAATSRAFGAGVSATAGVVKELHDLRMGGAFSGYDLLWDAAGTAAAYGVAEASR